MLLITLYIVAIMAMLMHKTLIAGAVGVNSRIRCYEKFRIRGGDVGQIKRIISYVKGKMYGVLEYTSLGYLVVVLPLNTPKTYNHIITRIVGFFTNGFSYNMVGVVA